MAQSREKQIIIGVVVLAALGGLVYRQAQQDKTMGTAASVSADLPSIAGSDDIDKISITNGDKGEVVLEKKDEKWRVTKPVDAPANQDNVKQLVSNLKELKAKEVIATNVTDDLKKTYELDASKAVHVQAWKGGDKKVDNYFGKYGGRGQMMMAADKPSIFGATGYSSYLYTREAKGWRETEIFRFEDTAANSVSIENKAGPFVFTKGEKGWTGTFKGKPIERFEEEKVKDLLRNFHSLNADDFGDGKSASDTGLGEPESTVSISVKESDKKYVLKVGKTQSGTARYAQKEGNDTIYVIPSWAADWAVAEPSKFQKPADAGAPKPAAAPGALGMPADPHGGHGH
jgi:hypothetical protein